MFGTILRVALSIVAVMLIINTLGTFLPQTTFDGINNSIIYFLGYINYLSPIAHTAVIFNIIKYLSGITLGLFYVIIVYGIVKLFSL
jgi:hypothetical protein